MDHRRGRRGHDPLRIRQVVEQRDIVGQRAREQIVVLEDGADLFAIVLIAEPRERDAVDKDLAGFRLEQAEENLDQGRFAGGRTMTRVRLLGGFVILACIGNVKSGAVVRKTDARDGRRVLVELSDVAASRIESYFGAVYSTARQPEYDLS